MFLRINLFSLLLILILLGYVSVDAANRSRAARRAARRAAKVKLGKAITAEAIKKNRLAKGGRGLDKSNKKKILLCQAKGDPHYTNFDKKVFDFQGKCGYTLAKMCSSPEGMELEEWEVQTANTPYGTKRSGVTIIEAMRFIMPRRNIIIEIPKMVPGKGFKPLVNGELVTLPYPAVVGDEDPWRLIQVDKEVVVETNFGVEAKYNGFKSVFVEVDKSLYAGRMCGLCGNGNGKKNDDFVLPNGKREKNKRRLGRAMFNAFAEQYAVPGFGTFPGCNKLEPEIQCNVGKMRKKYCKILNIKPFKKCMADEQVNAEEVLSECSMDMCLAPNAKERQLEMCDQLTSLSMLCRDLGYETHWQKQYKKCGPECVPNSSFRRGGSVCEPTCSDLNPDMSLPECSIFKDVCRCHPGFVRSNGKCVPVSECGCTSLDERSYVPLGNVVKSCTEECKCIKKRKNPPQMKCVTLEASCPKSERCVMDGGEPACDCLYGFKRVNDVCEEEKKCPLYSEYKESMLSCEPSCDNPMPDLTKLECKIEKSGCGCIKGFLRGADGTCQSQGLCICEDPLSGDLLKLGESHRTCQGMCSCALGGSVTCTEEPFDCGFQGSCADKDGRQECTCSVNSFLSEGKCIAIPTDDEPITIPQEPTTPFEFTTEPTRQFEPTPINSDFIPEPRIIEPPAKPATCGEGMIALNGKCYMVIDVSQTYNEASDFCRDLGGKLASIKSKQLNQLLAKNLKSANINSAWVGLRRL